MQLVFIPLFFGNLRGAQLIVIVVLILLLFGGISRIPKMMRSLGQGVHAFKQGLEDAKEEIRKPIEKATNDIDRNVDAPVNPTAKAKDVD